MTDQSGITPPAPGEDPRVPRLGGATAYTPPDAAPQPPAPQPPAPQPPAPQPPAYGSAGGYQAPAQPYGTAAGYQAPAQPYGTAAGYQAPAQPYGTAAGYQAPAPYGAQPQPPYGTHSPYAPQNAYPAGYGAPGQAMQQPQTPYGYAPGQLPPGYGQPPERSGLLGMIGLAMVTIAGVAAAVMGYLIGGVVGRFAALQLTLGASTTMDMNDPRVQELVNQNGWMALSTPVFLLGLAGFIVSIVAFATRRGRKLGLWGILLGVAFPILSIVLMVVGLLPYIPQ